MEPNKLLQFVSGLVKAKDFLFTTIPSVTLFGLDSADENFINFLSADETGAISAIIGLSLSKISDLTVSKWLNRKSAIKKANAFLELLESDKNSSHYNDNDKSKIDVIINKINVKLNQFQSKVVSTSELNKARTKEMEAYDLILDSITPLQNPVTTNP